MCYFVFLHFATARSSQKQAYSETLLAIWPWHSSVAQVYWQCKVKHTRWVGSAMVGRQTNRRRGQEIMGWFNSRMRCFEMVTNILGWLTVCEHANNPGI